MTHRSHADTHDPERPIVIGVLGGIAAGKSAVARYLAGKDGVVIDADRIAREVIASEEVASLIGAAFGQGVLHGDGSVDRSKLGQRVFASDADRERLESFTHPRIRARIRADLEAARRARAPRIVLDVPLLLENDDRHHLASECDAFVFVDADDRARDARAVAARGWPSGEVARRERTQMDLSAKRAHADHVIHNTGSIADLERDTARVVQSLRRSRP
jgi:dephospho-CoA kinase